MGIPVGKFNPVSAVWPASFECAEPGCLVDGLVRVPAAGCVPAGRLADRENVRPVGQWQEWGLFKVGEQACAFTGG